MEVPYDKLLLSTGSSPIRPPIAGTNAGLPNVFVMRNLQDADAMKARVDGLVTAAKAGKAGMGGGKYAGHAVVLGAGFIGLEMVEMLVKRGLHVTLVEARDHVLPIMDPEMVTPLTNDLRLAGVQVMTEQRASEIARAAPGSERLVMQLSCGASLPADLVLLSTGVRPESGLAAAAGLELDPATKAILVDERLRTSDPDIYAVGDAVAAPSLLNPARKVWVPLGGPANRQARLAADSIALGDAADRYRGTLGTSIVRAFNSVAGMTGSSEQALQRAGADYGSVVVHGYNHASYYPGNEPITLKALYDKNTRKLLGGQACGGSDGVDKRLDVLATAISTGATVDDLAHLELSYAPPFGSARDVINSLGFAAQNMAQGLLLPLPERSLRDVPADRVVVDVRDSTSASIRPVSALLPEGVRSINIPMEQLRDAVSSLDKSKQYTAVCNLGKMSYFGGRVQQQAGLQATSLLGGLSLASPPQANLPLEEAASTTETQTHGGAAAVPAAAAPVAPASKVVEVDACGLACPGPIMALRKALPLAPGDTLIARASDPGFMNDVRAFARNAGISVENVVREKGVITATLHAPGAAAAASASAAAGPVASAPVAAALAPNDLAIVVFSGDMDKVLAALVMANGAVAMGGKATLFFTFWGLPALRNDGSLKDLKIADGAHAEGDVVHPATGIAATMSSMFSKMLPKGPNSLPLSHFKFNGMGPAMMKKVMESKHLPSVTGLLREALESGQVRFVACTMSMDAMSIGPEELLPGVELGGVADFLASANGAKTTLFI